MTVLASELVTFVSMQPMRREHVPEVTAIEAQVCPQPWSDNLFMSELELPTVRDYTVAIVGKTVVGYSGLSYVADEAHVTTMAVDPHYQRKSIGTKLMKENVRLCVERGVPNMTLEVRSSSIPAQCLYRKFGFAPAGVRKKYYSNPTEDALVMWVHEINSEQYAQRLARLARLGPEIEKVVL